MEKLELHKIVGYLPYGLKGLYTLSDVITLSSGQKDEIRDKEFNIDSIKFFIQYCKPILRPISDLTKEIEVDGEKFVFSDVYFSRNKIQKLQDNSLCMFNNPLNDIDYNSVQTLLKYHFDIHGLINRGLAININEI